MKFIRNSLEKAKPLFHKGGKLEKLYPVYEAVDTFLYTPGEVTHGASHVRDGLDLKRMMITVVLALMPCVYMACWNTGYQANVALQELTSAGTTAEQLVASGGWRLSLLQAIGFQIGGEPSLLFNLLHGALYFVPVYLVTNMVGGACEAIFCIIRKHELNEGFLVTGMLFPLTLPPTIPLWQVALGIAFGVVLGKEVFGGTGKNFLNPALTARAFLYFAYRTDHRRQGLGGSRRIYRTNTPDHHGVANADSARFTEFCEHSGTGSAWNDLVGCLYGMDSRIHGRNFGVRLPAGSHHPDRDRSWLMEDHVGSPDRINGAGRCAAWNGKSDQCSLPDSSSLASGHRRSGLWTCVYGHRPGLCGDDQLG